MDAQRHAGDASVRTYAGVGAAELTAVTGLLTVQGAPLAPGGAAAGTTTVTGSLTLSGGLSLTLHGAGSGQFDQVRVSGPVSLGGPLTVATGGYTPAIGETLLLIANDGGDPVSGAFAGLPEGASLTVGGLALTISYAGGDGNDVTLTGPASAAPAFTSPPPSAGAYGASYQHIFTAGGEPAATFSVSAGALPSGLSLDPATGVLSGVPAQTGVYGGIAVTASTGDAAATQSITLTIARAPLTITAEDKAMVAGEALPPLRARYSGFMNGDTPVTLSTTVTSASPPGVYQITPGGAEDANYTISFEAGSLTVQPAGPSLRALTGERGRPGSHFSFEAAGFAGGTPLQIDVDGRVVLRGVASQDGSLRFILVFAGSAPARSSQIGAAGEAAAQPGVARATATVTLDSAAPLVMPTPGPALPAANALPTVYLPLLR